MFFNIKIAFNWSAKSVFFFDPIKKKKKETAKNSYYYSQGYGRG